MLQAYRSVLFVPGHRPTWVDKAIASGADAVVLDLEDSVPLGEKAAARATVAESIRRVRSSGRVMIIATSSCTCSIEPGRGTADWRTW